MEFISLQNTLDSIVNCIVTPSDQDIANMSALDERYRIYLMPTAEHYFEPVKDVVLYNIQRHFYNNVAIRICKESVAAAWLDKVLSDSEGSAQLWLDIGDTGYPKRSSKSHDSMMALILKVVGRNALLKHKSYKNGYFSYSLDEVVSETSLSKSELIDAKEKGFDKSEIANLLRRYDIEFDFVVEPDLPSLAPQLSVQAEQKKSQIHKLDEEEDNTREDPLTFLIERAIADIDPYSRAAIYCKLLDYAMNAELPLTTNIEGGALHYTNNKGKLVQVTRAALDARLRRREARIKTAASTPKNSQK